MNRIFAMFAALGSQPQSKKPLWPASFAMVLLLAASALATAQMSTTATITGTAHDASGAVIPGATVTVTDQATNTTIKAETNASGLFVVPGLKVSTYKVEVAKTGFAASTVTDVELHPAATRNLDFALNIGSNEQAVTIVATGAAVETETSENANSVAGQQVQTLPINGRNYQGLATLMPGVQNTSAGSALTTGGRSTNNVLSINGMQTNKPFFTIDGIWNENTGNMSQTAIIPNPDSLEEVRVLQNNFSARYSLMGSSIVLLQTRSGTSSFHGTAWEFLRNDDLNAKPYFSTSVLPYKQNIFGYNISGPVFIPHAYNRKRDKTFFFVTQQWVILHQVPSNLLATTPTANQRAGVFNSPIKNPATGTNFAQNAGGQYVIPNSSLNSNSVAYLATLYPLPNYTSSSGQNYINTIPRITNQRDDEYKIDHRFNDRFSVLAEYLSEHQTYAQNSLSGTQSGENFSVNTERDYTHNRLAQIAFTQTYTPNLVNVTNIATSTYLLDLDLAGLSQVSDIPGFTKSFPYAGAQSSRIPYVSFSGGIAPQGIPANLPRDHAGDLTDTTGDDISYLRGKHYIQSGIGAVFHTKRQPVGTTSNGQFTFTGNFTKPASGAVTQDDAIADFLLGRPTTFTQASDELHVVVHSTEISFYGEDRYTPVKRFSATVGLRISFMPLPSGPLGTENIFAPYAYTAAAAPTVNANGTITTGPNYSATNGLLLNSAKTGGLPQNFSTAHQWYFMPDIGFALDVFGDGKTSLKGGYGISDTRIFTNQDCSFNCASNPPAIQNSNLQNPNFPNVVGSGSAAPVTIAALSNADLNVRATPIISYSLGLEHEFAGNTIVSIVGAASQARHLLGTWDYNAPPHFGTFDFNPAINTGSVSQYVYGPYQGYAAISTLLSRQNQNFNALEINVRHHTKNLFATVAYTFSHDLTDFTTGTYSAIDPYNPSRYYGNAEGLNYPHSVAFTAIYNLPTLLGKNPVERLALGGWKLSDITTIRSGTSLSGGLSVSNQGNAVRADRVPGTSVAGAKTFTQWFNTAAFKAPAAGYYGNGGTGIIQGPGLVTFDMALYKDFLITERHAFEFRAEAFNIFNHTNPSGISTSFGSSTFGTVTTALDPRILEVAMKYRF